MSLIRRKPRPLQRDAESFRDDRLFIVACDDTFAPKQYFGFFKLVRVQVHVVPTEDGSSAANHVLDRLLQFQCEEDDERWLVLDTDHFIRGTHIQNFLAVLQAAKQRGIQVALSRPSFDLWLLLHHLDETTVAGYANANEVGAALRSVLGQYDKRKLDGAAFPLESVVVACRRAEALDATVEGGDIPQGNTSRVYKLWKAIVAKAHPSQLPEELRALRS
jgi:hypothetical protein